MNHNSNPNPNPNYHPNPNPNPNPNPVENPVETCGQASYIATLTAQGPLIFACIWDTGQFDPGHFERTRNNARVRQRNYKMFQFKTEPFIILDGITSILGM